MQEAFIFDACRTAVGKFGGTLSAVRTDDLAAHVIRTIVERNNLDATAIEDVIIGCANQAGEDNRNVARMSLLLAGLPVSVPGQTVNRLCASGLSATISAAREIQVGAAQLMLAGGVENMTRAPYVISKSAQQWGRDGKMWDTTLGWRFPNSEMEKQFGTEGMGETAENVAEMFSISRGDQDEFAAMSQQKAAKARENGRLAKEIIPISIPQRKADPIVFDSDEFIRPGTTAEILSKLRAVFRKDGSVTAGNSSGINDGAAALILGSEGAARNSGIQPRARFVSGAAVGVEPRIMGMGPVEATRKALKLAGLKLNQIDVIELNEAFAAQSLACMRELGLDDDDPRVNPNGGAIAIGHPLGMSGARLLTTAIYELEERQARYALCTMCVGVGQGVAAIIERV